MSGMYNIAKVRAWIKAAARKPSIPDNHIRLIYDAQNELLSDCAAMFRVTPEMHPTLLEIFGHLNGGRITATGRDTTLISTMKELVEKAEADTTADTLVDSGLTLRLDEGGQVWILRQDKGKVLINAQYAEMFTELQGMSLLAWQAPREFVGVRVSFGGRIAALIMPYIASGKQAQRLDFEFI